MRRLKGHELCASTAARIAAMLRKTRPKLSAAARQDPKRRRAGWPEAYCRAVPPRCRPVREPRRAWNRASPSSFAGCCSAQFRVEAPPGRQRQGVGDCAANYPDVEVMMATIRQLIQTSPAKANDL